VQAEVPGYTWLTDVDIANNTVNYSSGYGGGIDFEGHYIGLLRVKLHDNHIEGGNSQYAGGGMSVFYGTAVLTDSAVYNNVAETGPGGGLHASYGATLTVVSSAIYNNQALAGMGGGISLTPVGGGSRLWLIDSTVSGNSSGAGAGGVDMGVVNNYATISYTTFYSNASPVVSNLTGTVVLHGSIIAAGHGGPNCGSFMKSFGYNLDDGNSCHLFATGDLTSTNPLLGELLWNGGPTPTHAVLAGSPVIDAGDPAICPATDQRGGVRPVDGDGAGGARCDIGAFEFGALVPRLFLPFLWK
jgi:hypothetical protein